MKTLVLLPGMDGTGELFQPFVNALHGEFKIFTVRYPSNRHLSAFELISIIREACPVSEPFVLVAESFSTPLAIQFAASRPDNLQGIVLCAGFATNPTHGWRRAFCSLLAPLIFYLPLPDFIARLWLVGPLAPPSFLKEVRAAISCVQPNVLATRLQAVLVCDASEALKQIAVPILYLQAKQNRLVSANCLEEIRQLKPQVTAASLEGPHLLLQCEPDSAAAAVAEFVKNLP